MQEEYKGSEIESIIKSIKRVIKNFKKNQYKKFGYTNLQIDSMILLLEDKKLNMNDVSEKLDLNRSTATKIMDALLKEGYIVREKDKKDGRVQYVYLTETGKQLAIEFKNQMKNYYGKLIDGLDREILKNMTESIKHIELIIEKS